MLIGGTAREYREGTLEATRLQIPAGATALGAAYYLSDDDLCYQDTIVQSGVASALTQGGGRTTEWVNVVLSRSRRPSRTWTATCADSNPQAWSVRVRPSTTAASISSSIAPMLVPDPSPVPPSAGDHCTGGSRQATAPPERASGGTRSAGLASPGTVHRSRSPMPGLRV